MVHQVPQKVRLGGPNKPLCHTIALGVVWQGRMMPNLERLA